MPKTGSSFCTSTISISRSQDVKPQWMPLVVYHLDAIFHSPTTKRKQFIEQCHIFFLPFCSGVNLKLSRCKHRMFLPSCGSFQYRILNTCLSVQTLSPFCVQKGERVLYAHYPDSEHLFVCPDSQHLLVR